MIIEHGLLQIKPGMEEEFVTTIDGAIPLIASTPGFIDITISRGLESPGTFLLLVRWETLEAHTVGFRESPQYQEWKGLLHHFYDPAPTVEHFDPVVTKP